VLYVGHVHLRVRLAFVTAVANVSHHTDDFTARFVDHIDPQPLANGILAEPKAARHRLIDKHSAPRCLGFKTRAPE
jgi:hypothetical protein